MSKRQKTQEDGGTPRVPLAKIPVGSIPRETRLFINNEWVAGHGKKFDTINPATEAKICTVDSANAADVDKAVAAPADELSPGGIVYYRHRESGWILVKVIKVDREGAFDGGATYVIGGAPQLKGAEVETERRRLFRSMPE